MRYPKKIYNIEGGSLVDIRVPQGTTLESLAALLGGRMPMGRPLKKSVEEKEEEEKKIKEELKKSSDPPWPKRLTKEELKRLTKDIAEGRPWPEPPWGKR